MDRFDHWDLRGCGLPQKAIVRRPERRHVPDALAVPFRGAVFQATQHLIKRGVSFHELRIADPKVLGCLPDRTNASR